MFVGSAEGLGETKQNIISCKVWLVSSLTEDFGGVWRYLPDMIYDNEYSALRHVKELGYNDRGKPIGDITEYYVYRFYPPEAEGLYEEKPWWSQSDRLGT